MIIVGRRMVMVFRRIMTVNHPNHQDDNGEGWEDDDGYDDNGGKEDGS